MSVFLSPSANFSTVEFFKGQMALKSRGPIPMVYGLGPRVVNPYMATDSQSPLGYMSSKRFDAKEQLGSCRSIGRTMEAFNKRLCSIPHCSSRLDSGPAWMDST